MMRNSVRRALASMTAAAVLAVPCVGLTAETGDYWFLEGYEDGQLHLDQNLTRAEFAKMVAEAFDLQNAAEKTFTDLDSSHWSYPYVMRVVQAGAIDGYSDGSFRPDDLVTFEEAAKIASGLLLNSWNVQLEKGVATAIEYGITDGIQAMIGEDITRGEAAQMISNALQVKEETVNCWTGGVTTGVISSGSEDTSGTDSESDTVLGFNVDGNRNYDSGSTSDGNEYLGGGGGLPVVTDIEVQGVTGENQFVDTSDTSDSAFPVDTDTASYHMLRRFILNGQAPEEGDLQTQELINYFDYNAPLPEDGETFGISAELGECPWNTENQLVRVAVQAKEAVAEDQPNNLVFLVDVSGSMYGGNKLPALKEGLRALADTLKEEDRLSIVVYANGVKVILDGATGIEREKINSAIDQLGTSGGNSSGDGLTMAYNQVDKYLVEGNNRVVICSDGDFSVGLNTGNQLKSLIRQGNSRGIYVTALGLDMNNYRDAALAAFAVNGQGSYAYIDNAKEARQILTDTVTSPIATIAEDVSLQVSFNSRYVASYRLVGYENAAEMTENAVNSAPYTEDLGAGARVTALYEIVPARDGQTTSSSETTEETSGQLLDVKVQYKEPESGEEKTAAYALDADAAGTVSADFYFASALAELGMLLNGSEYAGTSSYDAVITLAEQGLGEDPYNLKGEFIQLVDLLRNI